MVVVIRKGAHARWRMKMQYDRHTVTFESVLTPGEIRSTQFVTKAEAEAFIGRHEAKGGKVLEIKPYAVEELRALVCSMSPELAAMFTK
jgi:hypothetical protein